MTSLLRRFFCACVLVVVAAGVPSGPADSALLCGNRWVNTNYVLSNNCLKACLNNHHSMADCVTTLVPLCQSCWRGLAACAGNQTIPAAVHCQECTDRYAVCMRSFF